MDSSDNTYYNLQKIQSGGANKSFVDRPAPSKVISSPDGKTFIDKNLWRRYKDPETGKFLFYNEAINKSIWQQDGGSSSELEKAKHDLIEEVEKIREERMTEHKYNELQSKYNALEQKYDDLIKEKERLEHLALKYKAKYMIR